MIASNLVSTYYAYRFAYLISQKWEDTDAFRLGILDKNGKWLKKPSELKTQEEKIAANKFNIVVWNIKRLLDKVPLGSSIMGRYTAAIALLKEANFHGLEDAVNSYICENILENVEVSGIEMVDKRLALKEEDDLADNEPEEWAFGARVFTCDPDTFDRCRHGKPFKKHYKTYIGQTTNFDKIREYCLKNQKSSVILKDSQTGTMIYLRKK